MRSERGKRLTKLCLMPRAIAVRTSGMMESRPDMAIWLIQSRNAARPRYAVSCTGQRGVSTALLDMTQWPESEVSSPIEDLVAEAKESAGVTDAYGFAEWLVQVKEHFGRVERMPISEMEGAYDEAMGWWEIGNKA